MTVIEASAAARAAGRRHASTPVRRLPRLPYFVSRVFFVAAVLLLAQALLPALLWLGPLVDSYSTLFVPIDSGSIALAAFMLILGAGLARRKRAAWLITVVWFGFLLLVDLFTVAVLVLLVFAGQIDFPDLPTLARFGFNLASLGTLFAFLVVYRGEFTARRPPGSIRRALITLLVGCLITFGVGVLLVSVFPGGLVRPTGRIAWMARRIGVGLVGGNTAALTSPISAPPGWINTVISILIALTLLASALALLRSQRRAALVTPADEPKIRALVAQSPDDSLAYFATRRDKSVVFAPDGSSAVMYRVDLGVCLASSDPIGARDHWDRAISAWLVLVRTYGWTPAVLGASEAGATAYARAGMQVIRLGDEAILAAAEFHLDAHDMRPVRQAVTRLERMGYGTRIRRHRDIGPAEFAALIAHTDAWRDTEAERGFSMALGRLDDPADGDCLMVEATFPPDRREAGPAGDVAAILSLVPWGSDGYSLDVMRRHPGADNGVNELMVTRLMAAGRDFGYRRVSLNFAVFRSAFEEGARIGAGPVLRLWRRLLLVASRWWQIESLFRSNVKYRPEWQPRFLCFEETRDIALVGAASGVAEGFIDLPNFLRRPGQEAARPLPVDGPVPVPAIPAAPVTAPRVPEQTRLRLQIREHILASGGDPYPVTFRPSRGCASLRLGGRARVAGRVIAVRDFGGVVFVQIRDWTGDAQLILTRAETGGRALADFRRLVDLGDQLGATGSGVLSRSGELSLQVADWVLTAKSLRPPPDKHRGLTDPEARVRQRYLDLAVNPAARTQLSARSRAVRAVRDTLDARGFLEVETPILQTVHGGANARPFRTHINAYDLDLYLRIAPELYLKRLLVGGVDRVFEIGRNFRNEGADATHNPEFTMLEAYEAYGDYATMRTIAFDLVTSAARAAIGGTLIRGQDSHGACQEVDLAEPWRVVPVNEAVSAASGEEITADTGRERLARLAERLGIVIDDRWSRGAVLLELYEHLVEHRTLAPTFYTDFPAEVSPLTRAHRVDPRLAERWDLVAFGAEIGTAYSELVDPVEQRARLTAQSLLAAGGDPEAMELDEDFLDALEYAMPPSGGLGMGLDRLVMLLTNATIRDTVTFPLVRPRRRG